jgi:hypothetical protein
MANERHRRRRRIVLVAMLVGLVCIPAARALLAQTPVVTSARNDFGPGGGWHASGDELLVFGQSRPGKPYTYDAYVWRVTGSGTTKTKLNTTGTGFGGGVDSPLVVYQQVAAGNSDIKLYNLDTGTRGSPGAGVNTRNWEWRPTISGDWLLFGRSARSGATERVILYNRTTREQRVLGTTTKRSDFVVPGQVTGNWAVFFRCTRAQHGCTVVRYDIAAKTKRVVPRRNTAASRSQYGASVTPSGIVYLMRSGYGCGTSVRLVRFFGQGDPQYGTVLASIPAGKDTYYTYARVNPDTSVDVLFDRGSCRGNPNLDIYKVTEPPEES